MVYEVLHSVLVDGARLASAVLPAAPLLGLKRPAAFGQGSQRFSTKRRKMRPMRPLNGNVTMHDPAICG